MATGPQQQRRLVIDTYNKIVNDEVKNGLQLLDTTIKYLKYEKSNIAELSLLYCLKSDYLCDNGLYDDAYKLIMDAVKMDSERKEVLQSLINIYTPRLISNDNKSNANPYEDDEKAKEYATKLAFLYTDDPNSLYIAGQTFSTLGLYDDSLRVLKKAFFILVKPNNNGFNFNYAVPKNLAEEIKKKITDTYIDRYSNIPNNSHEIIIKYLIELIEWKYNDFNASNLTICLQEIWERMEYILINHQNEWNKIQKLLSNIPCSIPLSANILNLTYDVFKINKKYYPGVEFFTRLITEYQTYNDNMLNLHAKFEKYHILYLNRAKLYQILNKYDEMLEDLDDCNTRLLFKQTDIKKVTTQNLSNYILNQENEKPMIETVQQIKKRRASRLSNISISPMPKQYRDFHLTPKSAKNTVTHGTSKRKKLKFKRYSLNHIDQMVANNYENKEDEQNDEYLKLQSQNNLLENKIIDLKNDLNRATSKNSEYKNEVEQLQQKMVNLTDNSYLHRSDTENADGEKQEYQENKKHIMSELQSANQANQTNQQTIKSLKRQIAILKDCKMKNKALKIKTEPKKVKRTFSICGCIGKLMKLLIGLFIFLSLVILFYDWMVSMELPYL